ncbi:MAG TPA: hypothetical protein PKN87_05130 [Syntrophomonadaceae bacterium]|nr:hypothetical protein [Syntrophomonadaceae bacterium]HPR92876.1 hypothetical protein [Syntrophomonadaceae bacterium]
MIILLLIGFGLVALIQIPRLIKKQWRRELICFSILWAIGLILSLIIAMGITLPPVSTLINHTISGWFGL